MNPVLTSEGDFAKAVEHKFVQSTGKGKYPKNIKLFIALKKTDIFYPVHLRALWVLRNPPEDLPGLLESIVSGTGPYGGWQNTHGNNAHTAIHLPIQQEPQTRGAEGSVSSSLSPPTPQRLVSIELESQKEVQKPGGKQSHDKGESSHYPNYRVKAEPERVYSDSSMFTRSKPTRLPRGFTPLRHQKIIDQEEPFCTILGIFKGKEQYLFQPEEDIVRPHYLEAVGLS
ncbi:hypothetical protein O181_022223 [Austropuccinia psidii MF-1]|uniref:Uncharacterized protein n=1 Tax=Austropuccinia psidii MF-1 TaxID=1389203 RepID=A0A9Q3CES8_9BASI|nr:hypothetical protein [Austropuccinia psidii MF-1]